MQVSDTNHVKIYNLSAGKSLPDWLSERKRRTLQKKSIDIRRRIELIQDFEMPVLSTTVKTTPDGQYILTTGIYKPRIRCYDVENLSMKFDRCFDSDVITFESLSEDYSKIAFLQCDRHVEFHSAPGRYYRLRIPKFGRDMKYYSPSCDLFIVASGPDIYRLNLERGQFLNSFQTESRQLTRCAVNEDHHLLVTGTIEGRVEAWDPRARNRVGILDVARNCITSKGRVEEVPSVTALKFKGPLNLGVGTSNGQILLYDLRNNAPYIIKEHMNDNLYSISEIDFHTIGQESFVMSLDSEDLKFWNENSGKLFTHIKAKDDNYFNHFCHVPNTGMVFIANEGAKIQTYYIPTIGPAPKWAGFLDTLTDELEETAPQSVFDDYKFVTKVELHELGLGDLEGTLMLRPFMHGFYIDARLYRKAKSAADPFDIDQLRKRKLREHIEQERNQRGVQLESDLPKINRDLAIKLKSLENDKKVKNRTQAKLLKDPRFSELFTNTDFQVDTTTEEYRLLNPVVSRLAKTPKIIQKEVGNEDEQNDLDDMSEAHSSDEDLLQDSSSDDEKAWAKDVQLEHKKIKWEQRVKQREEAMKKDSMENDSKTNRTFSVTEQQDFRQGIHSFKEQRRVKKEKKLTLEQRVSSDPVSNETYHRIGGAREMTFKVTRNKEARKKHIAERSHYIKRTAGPNSLKKWQNKMKM